MECVKRAARRENRTLENQHVCGQCAKMRERSNARTCTRTRACANCERAKCIITIKWTESLMLGRACYISSIYDCWPRTAASAEFASISVFNSCDKFHMDCVWFYNNVWRIIKMEKNEKNEIMQNEENAEKNRQEFANVNCDNSDLFGLLHMHTVQHRSRSLQRQMWWLHTNTRRWHNENATTRQNEIELNIGYLHKKLIINISLELNEIQAILVHLFFLVIIPSINFIGTKTVPMWNGYAMRLIYKTNRTLWKCRVQWQGELAGQAENRSQQYTCTFCDGLCDWCGSVVISAWLRSTRESKHQTSWSNHTYFVPNRRFIVARRCRHA